MRKIPTLPFGAAGCAIIPGRSLDDEGFIETGRILQGVDPLVYLSAAGLREAVRLLDEPTRDEELRARDDRIRELEEECNRLQQIVDSIDGLVKPGYVIRKAPGRKPKKEVVGG